MLKDPFRDRINIENHRTIFYFGTDSFGGAFPKNLATVGTMAMVTPSRSGSVNLVITHDIANVPTIKLKQVETKHQKNICLPSLKKTSQSKQVYDKEASLINIRIEGICVAFLYCSSVPSIFSSPFILHYFLTLTARIFPNVSRQITISSCTLN
jgi:hypothetical protein